MAYMLFVGAPTDLFAEGPKWSSDTCERNEPAALYCFCVPHWDWGLFICLISPLGGHIIKLILSSSQHFFYTQNNLFFYTGVIKHK